MKENQSTFRRLFTLAALMFGTYCGGTMASGVYATAYMATFGGGWLFVFLGIFFLFLTFFCTIALDFAHAFQTYDYNTYALELYNINREDASPVLKTIVSAYFDIFNILLGGITAAATIALFGELFNQLFGISMTFASWVAVFLFAFLTVYGASFLRKFNTVMTISLMVSLGLILLAVIMHRGDVLAHRLGNFEIGMDWSGTTLRSHFTMLLAYCITTSNWGSTLTNPIEVINSRRDTVIAGVMMSALVTLLFMVTSFIVIPYMPEYMNNVPILSITRDFLHPFLVDVYWLIVIISVISTGPSFAFNIANRYSKVWKTEKISESMKFFIISLIFLTMCYFLSKLGLMTIAQKGFSFMGYLAIPGIALPMVIGIFRTNKKRREENIK